MSSTSIKVNTCDLGPRKRLPDSQALPAKLVKYYYQRYNLFSRFDDGIQLDDESWYSVTPENIAKHQAERLCGIGGESPLILDAFCGVGGNLIQFASYSPCSRVIGCDLNYDRLKMAQNNAKIYGVAHRCELVHGDFMDIIKSFRPRSVDAVFLSPPWGGVDYRCQKTYSLNSMQPNGFELVRLCRKYLTNNIAFLLPRNVDLKEIKKELADKENPYIEFESNKVGEKIKTITVYFGALIDHSMDTDSD